MLVLLSLAFAVMAYYTFDQKVAASGDNVAYYLLGQSLADSGEYSNPYKANPAPENQYSPGYPFIISVAKRLGVTQTTGIKVLNYGLLFGAIVLLFFIIKSITNNLHVAFVVALLCVFNVQLLSFATVMLSEIPFLFCSMASLYFLLRVESKFRWGNYHFWLFVLLAAAGYYIRTVGVVLVLAACGHFLLARQWKHLLATATGFVLLVLPWAMRSRALGGNSYLNKLTLINPARPELGTMDWGDWLPRMGRNIERYFTKEIPLAFFPQEVDYSASATAGHWLLGIAIALLVLIGLWQLKQWRVLLVLYILGTFALLLCWPEIWFGPRFIVPLMPLLILGVVLLLAAAQKRWKNSAWLPYCSLLLLWPSLVGVGALHERANANYPEEEHRYFELAKWANANLADDAVVACRKPALFYLFAQRKAVPYKMTTDADDFMRNLTLNKATHLVFDELGYGSYDQYLMPAANAYSGKLVPVYKFENHPTQICTLRMDLGYFGERKNGLRHGEGKFIWADGRVYEGRWENHERNGYGTLRWPNGQTYRGGWEHNEITGAGMLTKPDGTHFVGQWKQGRREGEGALYNAKAEVIQEGVWRNDTLIAP